MTIRHPMNKKKLYRYKINDINDMKVVKVEYEDQNVLIIDELENLSDGDAARPDFIMVFLCRSGSISMKIKDKEYMIHENDVVISLPNILIENRTKSSDFTFKALCLSDKMIQRFMRERNIPELTLYLRDNPVLHLNEKDISILYKCMDLLSDLLQSEEKVYIKQIIASMIDIVFYGVLGKLSQTIKNGNTSQSERNTILFKQFMELFSSQKIKSRKTSFYASCLCVSQKHLSNACLRISGKTSFQWINESVAEDIKFLLEYSDTSIKELAFMLDFPNASFFCRFCKKHLGISPLRFRKQKNS